MIRGWLRAEKGTARRRETKNLLLWGLALPSLYIVYKLVWVGFKYVLCVIEHNRGGESKFKSAMWSIFKLYPFDIRWTKIIQVIVLFWQWKQPRWRTGVSNNDIKYLYSNFRFLPQPHGIISNAVYHIKNHSDAIMNDVIWRAPNGQDWLLCYMLEVMSSFHPHRRPTTVFPSYHHLPSA